MRNDMELQKRYKARWQAFERDKFTCQYCGHKAPDVVIVTCSNSTEANDLNNPDNLVTCCMACGRGRASQKRAEELAKIREMAGTPGYVAPVSFILELLAKGALRVPDICKQLGVSDNYIRPKLSELKRRGLVINIKPGLWGLTAKD